MLFIEQPRIVRTTATKFEFISKPIATNAPYVITTSWRRAITAHIPEDQSLILLNRKAIYMIRISAENATATIHFIKKSIPEEAETSVESRSSISFSAYIVSNSVVRAVYFSAVRPLFLLICFQIPL